MATYTQEYDAALLQVPWLSKTDSSSKPFLIKHARHPTKPGYILLLTDLTKVYFEPLVGIRLLARQREVEENHGETQRARDGGGSSLDMGGGEAVQEVLDGLDGLMGTELEEAELAVSAGDLYYTTQGSQDLDVVMKSQSTHWVFHMTEIRYGCLEVITRHITHPLALSITSSKRPASSTDQQIVELVSSEVVLSAINSHSAHPVKGPETKGSETSDTAQRPGKSRLVRRRDPTASKPASETPEPEASSSRKAGAPTRSPSPTLRNANSQPTKRDSPSPPAEDDEMMPDEAESGPPTPAPEGRSPPSPRQDKAKKKPDADEDQARQINKHAKDDLSDAGTPDPPPLPPPSQKTQQEKDEEEEEELARKRDEMKRKMGAGGGGRLVRRRVGR